MADTVASQNIELSSWYTQYINGVDVCGCMSVILHAVLYRPAALEILCWPNPISTYIRIKEAKQIKCIFIFFNKYDCRDE
jgi:hypothetical protein